MHSRNDLEQLAFWQETRKQSLHWYNVREPVISVELKEGERRWIVNNEEVQMDLSVYQHRVPGWNENLLMSLSDALLRGIQRWLTRKNLPMTTRCVLSLQEEESNPLPLTRCLGIITNTPVFAFFSWTVSLSRTMLAKLDSLSYNWLLAKFLSPRNSVNLVITVLHRDESSDHALLTS